MNSRKGEKACNDAVVSKKHPLTKAVAAGPKNGSICEVQSADQHLLKGALEAAANAVVITDSEGKIQWTNPAFTRLTQYASEEIVGKTPRLLSSGKHPPEFYKQMWQTILSGDVWHGELINRRKDGSLYTEDMTITPIRASSGKATHFVAVKQDITERKLLEEQYRQAQKMEALGTLACGIAHDFNNLLAIIGGYADAIDDHIGDDTTLLALLTPIRNAVTSGAALTSQLLALSRKQVVQPRVISINSVIRETANLLRRTLGEDILLDLRLNAKVSNVIADPGQLQQLIMNLAVNARDAMPKGGRLTITTSNITVNPRDRHVLLRPGRYVKLEVRDTGTGMDEATLQQAFQPFFTTKAPDRGTGLGLSTVYAIVKQSGGELSLSSTLGEGTIVTAYLGRVRRGVGGSKPKIRKDVPDGRTTILLVEDNLIMRKMIRQKLEKHGYTVIAAQNGAEALDSAERYQDRIHLLITDVIMPGMDGLELSARLKNCFPGVHTLYMSGYSAQKLHDRKLISPKEMFIAKPFDMKSFLQKVQRAFGAAENRKMSCTPAP